MAFDMYLSNNGRETWTPESGLLVVHPPEPLYFTSGDWVVALVDLSFDNTILNIDETQFAYTKRGGVRKSYRVPASHMDDIKSLLDVFSSVDRNMRFTVRDGGVVMASLPVGSALELSPSLRQITGLPELVVDGSIGIGYDLYSTCSPMMVAVDFCGKQIFNDQFRQFLKVLPPTYKNLQWGENFTINFPHLSFIPTTALEISKIAIQFQTPEGTPIKFSPSSCTVIATLRFTRLQLVL